MKNLLFLLLVPFFSGQTLAKDIQYLISYATFLAPETGPYAEIYFSIDGSSLTFQPTKDGKFQGGVEFMILFKQDSLIKKYDKYVLNSPVVTDSAGMAMNILDQKRYALPNGTYEVEINMKDIHDPTSETNLGYSLNMDYDTDKPRISDLQLLESYKPSEKQTVFTKNGYELTPYAINYFPTGTDKLKFYTEIYHTDKAIGDDAFLLSYSVRTRNSNKIVNDLTAFAKKTPKPVNILLSEIDISQLYTGNYNLVIEVRNKKNELITERKFFFQRSNKAVQAPELDVNSIDLAFSFSREITPDSLDFYLASLQPIASGQEADIIRSYVRSDDEALKRKHFHLFWQKRNPYEPEVDWKIYKKQVLKVEEVYSYQINHGFETDRGRVYLQYGSPNQIDREDHGGGALPYEIWQYYRLDNNQNNVIFVFYQPNLGANDFNLIHSTARGEIIDHNWKTKVFNNGLRPETDNFQPDNSFFRDRDNLGDFR